MFGVTIAWSRGHELWFWVLLTVRDADLRVLHHCFYSTSKELMMSYRQISSVSKKIKILVDLYTMSTLGSRLSPYFLQFGFCPYDWPELCFVQSEFAACFLIFPLLCTKPAHHLSSSRCAPPRYAKSFSHIYLQCAEPQTQHDKYKTKMGLN